MISIDGKEYRTLEEQVKYLTDNMGGEGAKLTEINVGKPDAVVYDSTDGALVTCKATVTYEDETSEEIDFEYYVPIIPGSNINIDASESDDRIVISATGGGGGTYTGGDGITVDANNAINANLGDGLEIDGDNNIAVKVDNDGYIGFSDDGVSLNNAGKNAIASVAGKLDANQISGTNDGTNWTQIQIKGVTKNIPTGGSGGVTSFDQLSGRPQYNGAAMTSSTNIPEVKNYTFNSAAGININTSGNVKTFSVDYAANDGLKTDGNDQLTVDYDQVQHKLTAGSNITISGNTISADSGITTISAGPGINVGSSGSGRTINLDLAADGGLETDGNDELAVDFDVVQHKLTAGTNITISGNTISATGGGASNHLYRHCIRLRYEDGGGEEVSFTLHNTQSTTMTFVQVVAALPTVVPIPATGNDGSSILYTGVYKNGTSIKIDTAEYDYNTEALSFGSDFADSNWNLLDQVTTIF